MREIRTTGGGICMGCEYQNCARDHGHSLGEEPLWDKHRQSIPCCDFGSARGKRPAPDCSGVQFGNTWLLWPASKLACAADDDLSGKANPTMITRLTGPVRPSTLLAVAASLVVAVVLSGCKGFWDPLPAGTGTSTGTTATTTTLTASNSSVSAGAGITLTATVAPAAATGTVTFYAGTATLGTGTLASGTASFTATFTTPGAESVTATYGGDATYAASTSSAVSVTVTSATPATLARTLSGLGGNAEMNYVLDAETPWTPPGVVHLHNLARAVADGSTVSNIDGGHCVLYSGTVYLIDGSKSKSGVFNLQGGGYVAPEQMGAELGCE